MTRVQNAGPIISSHAELVAPFFAAYLEMLADGRDVCATGTGEKKNQNKTENGNRVVCFATAAFQLDLLIVSVH